MDKDYRINKVNCKNQVYTENNLNNLLLHQTHSCQLIKSEKLDTP